MLILAWFVWLPRLTQLFATGGQSKCSLVNCFLRQSWCMRLHCFKHTSLFAIYMPIHTILEYIFIPQPLNRIRSTFTICFISCGYLIEAGMIRVMMLIQLGGTWPTLTITLMPLFFKNLRTCIQNVDWKPFLPLDRLFNKMNKRSKRTTAPLGSGEKLDAITGIKKARSMQTYKGTCEVYKVSRAYGIDS